MFFSSPSSSGARSPVRQDGEGTQYTSLTSQTQQTQLPSSNPNPFGTVRPNSPHSPHSPGSVYTTYSDPDKRMAHVGGGKGDYVQVTTFRYVGDGQGEFHMSAPPPEPYGPADYMRWCCYAICGLLAVVFLGWLVVPVHADLGSTFENFLVEKETTVLTTTPAPTTGGIELNLRVDDVHYTKLDSDEQSREGFARAVKYATAFYMGHGVDMDHIAVDVDQRAELVHAFIVPPCEANASRLAKVMNFTSLGKAIAANLHTTCCWQRHSNTGVHVTVVYGRQFGANCLAAEEELAAHVGTRASTTTVLMTTTLAPRTMVKIEGATGASASLVNGLYHRQDELYNNEMLFRKQDDPDVWIVFEKLRWYVTSTEKKEAHEGGGWLYSMEINQPHISEVNDWQMWNGAEWVDTHETVTVRWLEAEEATHAVHTSSVKDGSGATPPPHGPDPHAR